MKPIERPFYTQRILPYFGKGLVLVLTGQRRVGKSFLLKQLRERVEAEAGSHVIYINKEQSDFWGIANHSDLSAYVSEHLQSGKRNYLFIDEVQEIEGFERCIRSLQADDACEIVLTGSNAKMLSSELSTLLAGRYIEFHLQSLDYAEFLRFHNLADSDETLALYLDIGGLPQLFRIGKDNREMIEEYLDNVYNTIILKDVIARENIRNVGFLNNLTAFLSDNVGKQVSATSISKYMKSEQVSITTNAVLNFLNYLCNAYIVARVPRYDIHGKRLLESNAKYYFEDIGLRNHIAGFRRVGDIEKIIENAVFLHLRRQGYKVFVGQYNQFEFDFVAEKPGITKYFQVSYMLSGEDVIAREFGNLLKIRDHHPKFVVTLDKFQAATNYEGIGVVHLRDFLLSEP